MQTTKTMILRNHDGIMILRNHKEVMIQNSGIQG